MSASSCVRIREEEAPLNKYRERGRGLCAERKRKSTVGPKRMEQKRDSGGSLPLVA